VILAEHLHNVDRHWAVLAVGEAERDRGLKVADARLVKQAVGHQMFIDFPENDFDDELLHRLAMAYEMAAIEGLDAFLNPTSDDEELRKQCSAGAWRAFEIRRLFTLPENEIERISHLLHLSALAYCGDRWSDLRRWYNENEKSKQPGTVVCSIACSNAGFGFSAKRDGMIWTVSGKSLPACVKTRSNMRLVP